MTPQQAIEKQGYQSQIIDGPRPFGEIADVIRSLTKTVAAPARPNGEALCMSDWLDALTEKRERIKNRAVAKIKTKRSNIDMFHICETACRCGRGLGTYYRQECKTAIREARELAQPHNVGK